MSKPNAVYVVLIWVRPGQRDALHDYERQVRPILESHRGRFGNIVAVDGINESTIFTPGTGIPDEVHVLEFPDATCFDAWRTDPAMAKLATLREQVVDKVLFLSGTEAEIFVES